MPPGMTICPVASIRCLAEAADSVPAVAIAAIVSPATATSQRTTPSGVTTSPLRIMRSNIPPAHADKVDAIESTSECLPKLHQGKRCAAVRATDFHALRYPKMAEVRGLDEL